jgi:hypothetical protein
MSASVAGRCAPRSILAPDARAAADAGREPARLHRVRARAERLNALHQLFYGFYSRIAIVDRTTHELARWAKEDLVAIPDVSPGLAEAMRDNALHVGRDLFSARMQTMAAMKLVSGQLAELREPGSNPAFTQRFAVAFDEASATIRSYDLARPGEHPDLPYDPFAYDLGRLERLDLADDVADRLLRVAEQHRRLRVV